MFDFENPFSQAAQLAEDTGETDWDDSEWEPVVNAPEHQADADQRAAASEVEDADREALLTNFHERCEKRRRERTQISAFRYAVIALACGLLAYACSYYGINWLAWTIGTAASIFAIISSYGFGRVHEIG